MVIEYDIELLNKLKYVETATKKVILAKKWANNIIHNISTIGLRLGLQVLNNSWASHFDKASQQLGQHYEFFIIGPFSGQSFFFFTVSGILRL